MKKQNGFVSIFVIIGILAVVVLGLGVIYHNRQTKPTSYFQKKLSKDICTDDADYTCNKAVIDKLPSCVGNNLLTDSPIDLDNLPSINPLGHLGLPSHLVPMDHLGLDFPATLQNDSIKVDIKAPGAVHIIGVRQSIYMDKGAIQTKNYYSIAFTPCKELIFYFEDMGSISNQLQKAVEQASVKDQQDQKEGTHEYKLFRYHVDYVTSPGEVIGTGGGPDTISHGLSWGAYDLRVPKLKFLGVPFPPDQRVFYTTCPLDYYLPLLKDALYAKLERKVDPRCGTIMQDLGGTIQGNWSAQVEKGKSDDAGWSLLLGIIHYNVDPSVGEIGIGGVISNPGIFDFMPKHEGVINREPSEVSVDGKIYCYQTDNLWPKIPYIQKEQASGKFLFQLVDANTLKAEHQDGRCFENETFKSPVIYKR